MKSNSVFFFAVVVVIALIIFYSFSDNEINSVYKKEVIEFRTDKNDKFKTTEDSPFDKKQKALFDSLIYFEPNIAYRIEADFIVFDLPQTVTINTTTNKQRRYIKYAKAVFNLENQPHELILLKPEIPVNKEAANMLFLAFTDESSAEETYGAGRYLDLTIPKTKTIVLDFNYAYNPYCAYNDIYDCPIPLPENQLNIKILSCIPDVYYYALSCCIPCSRALYVPYHCYIHST